MSDQSDGAKQAIPSARNPKVAPPNQRDSDKTNVAQPGGDNSAARGSDDRYASETAYHTPESTDDAGAASKTKQNDGD